jgi:hypothetical protein
MLKFKVMLLTAAGSALLSAPALAQGRPLPPQPPPTHAQQGTAGPAIPPAPPAAATVTPRAGYGSPYGQTVVYTAIPVTVASDGRVYANFGFGYTLVPQQCSAQRLRLLGIRAGPVQGQSRAQQPAPHQPATATQGNAAPALQVQNGPCWTRTRNGAVVAYR